MAWRTLILLQRRLPGRSSRGALLHPAVAKVVLAPPALELALPGRLAPGLTLQAAAWSRGWPCPADADADADADANSVLDGTLQAAAAPVLTALIW